MAARHLLIQRRVVKLLPCKFHAVMTFRLSSLFRVAACWSIGSLAAASAHAERSDRLQKPTIESDGGGQVDLQRQTITFTGNVVVTQGSMVIRAGRIEVHELPSGYRVATAFGAPGRPATFRQKRDGVDETIEGRADRLEYDGKAETVRFVDNAEVRRLRGAVLADQASGNLIVYDGASERIDVSGGTRPTAANPTGRVRVVLTPRAGSEAATDAASAAGSVEPRPALKRAPALGQPPGTP